MSSQLTIRDATDDDVNALVELAANTFRDAYRLLDDPDEIEDYVAREFTPKIFAAILRDSASTLVVALEGERYVGYLHVKQSTPPPCVVGPSPIELARLYLRQDVIGRGYGATLMKVVHQIAKRARCKTIWLLVYSRNEHARNFYKRWGFIDVGTKDFIFGGRAYADPVMVTAMRDDL
jgi:GNAT superfamily N-acetyltransferase